MDIRSAMKLVEGLYDDQPDSDAPWSFGWWIWPNGSVDECPDEGTHVDLAWDVLDRQGDPDDAIHIMLEKGAIRIATFHGSNEMNINFDSRHVTPVARKSLARLLVQTRSWFMRYHFDDASLHGTTGHVLRILSYREAMAVARGR
jgi:hypothetical protein